MAEVLAPRFKESVDSDVSSVIFMSYHNLQYFLQSSSMYLLETLQKSFLCLMVSSSNMLRLHHFNVVKIITNKHKKEEKKRYSSESVSTEITSMGKFTPAVSCTKIVALFLSVIIKLNKKVYVIVFDIPTTKSL